MDTTTTTLTDLLTKLQQPQSTPTGWQQPQQPMIQPQAVNIPLSLNTPGGKIRVYLQFPGEVATSPQALLNLLQMLQTQGLPLDVWQGNSGGWSGNNNGFSRRSWR